LYTFIPIIILLAVFWLPSFISGQNIYLLSFINQQASEELKSTDYSFYAEFFPDPYTYHFAKEPYLANEFDLAEGSDLTRQIAIKKQSASVGAASVNLFDRLKIGTVLTIRHIFRFFSISETGGPLIFILVFLGLLTLKRQNNYWFSFYSFWFIGSVLLMGFIALVGRNHMMDFGFGLAVTSAFGIVLLSDLLSKDLYSAKFKNVIGVLLLIMVIYSLILSSHVMWSQKYENSRVPILNSYINEIKQSNVDNKDIIAVPLGVNEIYYINFNTNKSLVTFSNETIDTLLNDNKLIQVYDQFKVRHILGYSPELSKKISEQTAVSIIADSSIKVDYRNFSLTNKGWLLNLIK